MKCIIDATNCLHNTGGKCADKPDPEDLGCFGIVCFNIKTTRKDNLEDQERSENIA
ncbi:hypothetical protein Salpa_5862 [Sporomusa sp. KB1]|jgi:hypothetical protein|nr:hypothetical protein Salpa_5862 [Sporomusa sp. KB1]